MTALVMAMRACTVRAAPFFGLASASPRESDTALLAFGHTVAIRGVDSGA
jgi:hypothetical protein